MFLGFVDNLPMPIDISLLFSLDQPLRQVTTGNVSDIPSWGSIIYTVFLDSTEGGRHLKPESLEVEFF
jgi:hypothetical protein